MRQYNKKEIEENFFILFLIQKIVRFTEKKRKIIEIKLP
jgi:hypothetical protein